MPRRQCDSEDFHYSGNYARNSKVFTHHTRMRTASFRLFYFAIGQHYSYNVDWVFFEQLKLPDAKYNLDVGSGLHGKQTG